MSPVNSDLPYQRSPNVTVTPSFLDPSTGGYRHKSPGCGFARVICHSVPRSLEIYAHHSIKKQMIDHIITGQPGEVRQCSDISLHSFTLTSVRTIWVRLALSSLEDRE